MALVRYAVASVAIGVAVALVTGLYNSTPAGLVGASWYGFPFAWIRLLVVAPQYSPWSVDPLGLVLDCVVWVAVSSLVILLVARRRRQGSAHS